MNRMKGHQVLQNRVKSTDCANQMGGSCLWCGFAAAAVSANTDNAAAKWLGLNVIQL
jgi:hypothetical protein